VLNSRASAVLRICALPRS